MSPPARLSWKMFVDARENDITIYPICYLNNWEEDASNLDPYSRCCAPVASAEPRKPAGFYFASRRFICPPPRSRDFSSSPGHAKQKIWHLLFALHLGVYRAPSRRASSLLRRPYSPVVIRIFIFIKSARQKDNYVFRLRKRRIRQVE